MIYLKLFTANLLLLAFFITINLNEKTHILSINSQNAIKIDDANTKSLYLRKDNTLSITNLTSIVGKTVNLNCTLSNGFQSQFVSNLAINKNQFKYGQLRPSSPLSSAIDSGNNHLMISQSSTIKNDFIKFNPTWLKADLIYDQSSNIGASSNGVGSPGGLMANSFKTENIIVTRKGIIADLYRDKMRLVTVNDKLQILKINDVEIRDEGKYICREFNSQNDRLFYLNVYSPIKELNIKFTSNSKYFREMYTSSTSNFLENEPNNINDYHENSQPNMNSLISKTDLLNDFNYDTSTVTIKENDELTINCIVNSSKPAANISIWLLNRQIRRSPVFNSDVENEFASSNDDSSKLLNIIDSHTYKNKDYTLKSVSVAKYVLNRNDNHKIIACVAENSVLNEKWESKRMLNVLYAPKCSKNQKLVYNTGINQSIELECHMSEANPPYLDFTWNMGPNHQTSKDRVRSNGFISRINWMPKSESEFGEISCMASNGLELVECKMLLQLGGPPNPPFDCYHKENNKTIIIECKPGFEQGDPEVYFFLLKRKSNGVLVEYARKRDSCSFLISSLILEEHLNDFFIYSSNKYGNNKELATRITIENKEFLIKNSNKLQDVNIEPNRRVTIIGGIIFLSIFVLFFMCCLFFKCKSDKKHAINNNSILSSNNINTHLYTNPGNKVLKPASLNASNYMLKKNNGFSNSFNNINHNINSFNSSINTNNNNNNINVTTLNRNRYSNINNKNQFLSHQESYKYLSNSITATTNNLYNSKPSIRQDDSSTSNNVNSISTNTNNNSSNSNLVKFNQSSNKINNNSSIEDKNLTTSSSSTDLDNQDQMGIYDNSSFKKSFSKINYSKNVRSPSLINNIQDLDMSPKSKRKSVEKTKEPFACSRSLIDESTETDSENYMEFNRTKIRTDQYFENSISEDQDQKNDYYSTATIINNTANYSNIKTNTSNNTNQNSISKIKQHIQNSFESNPKINIWYNNSKNDASINNKTDSNDDYEGISTTSTTTKSSFTKKYNNNDQTYSSKINNTVNYKAQTISNKNNTHDSYDIKKLKYNDCLNDINDRDEHSLLNWSKNNLQSIFANLNTNIILNNSNTNSNSSSNHDTISLDVDDEKVVGILV